jgi:hypothetical protein
VSGGFDIGSAQRYLVGRGEYAQARKVRAATILRAKRQRLDEVGCPATRAMVLVHRPWREVRALPAMRQFVCGFCGDDTSECRGAAAQGVPCGA